MSEKFSEAACYDDVAMLLPWYATGRLSSEDAGIVEAHLQTCPMCKQDLERERRVRELMCTQQVVEFAPQPGLQQLLARIQNEDEASAKSVASYEPAPVRRLRGRRPLSFWLAAAVIVQTVGLGFLATLLWQQRAPNLRAPNYVTLSAPPPTLASQGQIRAVFAPSTRLVELQSICKTAGVTVVAGPSEAGVYTLAIVADPREERSVEISLASLRADSHVVFAEPLFAER